MHLLRTLMLALPLALGAGSMLAGGASAREVVGVGHYGHQGGYGHGGYGYGSGYGYGYGYGRPYYAPPPPPPHYWRPSPVYRPYYPPPPPRYYRRHWHRHGW
jgi:hypothetical protein